MRYCLAEGKDLVTTDHNLSRVAALQGVRVLNVNQLANGVKVTYMPGERLSLNVVKPGREAGQGLAYLRTARWWSWRTPPRSWAAASTPW